MLSLMWSTFLGLVAVPLLALTRQLRRWQLGRRGVLELSLTPQLRRRSSLEAIVSVTKLLRAMADDPLLRAVVLHVRQPALGHAGAQEIRSALVDLRRAGKLVFVQLEQAGAAELVLSSAADRVWLEPAGDVFLHGVEAQLVFYGDALKRLGVDVQVEAAGTFKSAGEPFARGFASTASRVALQALVDDLDAHQRGLITQGRPLEPAALTELVPLSPLSAELAQQRGLVDGVGHADEARVALEELLGESINPVPSHRYGRLLGLERRLEQWGHTERSIAVLHLEGPVVHGAGAGGGSGPRIDADRVVPTLNQLREDDDTGAVVLFINSPGGGALASDIIARAVQRLGAEKPVIAVFSDVAASGGYYLAAPAAEIIAQPGSITGSIGVVGGKVCISPALGQLGVHAQLVSSAVGGLSFSPWRPFSDAERRRFVELLQRTYDRFLAVVAAGRRRTVESVAVHAEGRVWTGRQALERGLVDRLGGLGDGIERARILSGLGAQAPVRHVHFRPPRLRVLAQLLGRRVSAEPDLVGLGLASMGEAGARLEMLRQHQGQALALLPWTFDNTGGRGPA